jgi:hypothetical protein
MPHSIKGTISLKDSIFDIVPAVAIVPAVIITILVAVVVMMEMIGRCLPVPRLDVGQPPFEVAV